MLVLASVSRANVDLSYAGFWSEVLVAAWRGCLKYCDQAFLVPKNSAVLIQRVPANLDMSITSDHKKKCESAEHTEHIPLPALPIRTKLRMAAPFECDLPEPASCLDTLGIDIIEDEVLKSQQSSISKDEDARIKEFVNASALEWQRYIQEGYSIGKFFQNGRKGRLANEFSSGHKVLNAEPHVGYICHRCGTPGHYIQRCPTKGDPAYDVKKVRIPKGIPRTMLTVNPDGFYVLPNGETAVITPNEIAFDKEMSGLLLKSTAFNIPLDYLCPLCHEVMKDAVISSKCCFKSFCDRCIRDHIISKAKCACGETNVLADHLLPNITIRDIINRLLQSSATSSSTGSAGRKAHSQASFPTLSSKEVLPVASTSEESTLTTLEVPDVKVPMQSANSTKKQKYVKDEDYTQSVKAVVRGPVTSKVSDLHQGIVQSKEKPSRKPGNRLLPMVTHDLSMTNSDMIAASSQSLQDSVMDCEELSSRNARATSPSLHFQEGMMGFDSTPERLVPSSKRHQPNHAETPQICRLNACDFYGADLGLSGDIPDMNVKRRRFHVIDGRHVCMGAQT
ncbi:hypothetical protein O6H91_23G009200 [Diphasiastrum complanatum]|uniref:Uncharacterized protein n=4 Tax=Diphasiastrum complanatum TaxID=34168 RepID=A0ACC2A7Z3_DIPCM|nr:hypothetical protein O6H91_23G009200 [Diphasiastrum complanatum]